jgi:hypothetical protein
MRNGVVGSAQDLVYAPLPSAVPSKPQGWKLELTDKAKDEAEMLFRGLKTEGTYAYRYYQAKPPMPMGWAPKDGGAWLETPAIYEIELHSCTLCFLRLCLVYYHFPGS